jgi:hypothetical protein
VGCEPRCGLVHIWRTVPAATPPAHGMSVRSAPRHRGVRGTTAAAALRRTYYAWFGIRPGLFDAPSPSPDLPWQAHNFLRVHRTPCSPVGQAIAGSSEDLPSAVKILHLPGHKHSGPMPGIAISTCSNELPRLALRQRMLLRLMAAPSCWPRATRCRSFGKANTRAGKAH